MSWEFLHAGKFVDGDGVVIDRAEHEFLARSEGFPDAIMALIARQDPARRMPPIEWNIGGHLVQAGFTQMAIRHDGQDYCLRVIDHQAFEGTETRTGRAYRKRTYLIQPADQWSGADAALPIDLLVLPPSFQAFTTVPAWDPDDITVDTGVLVDDLEQVLAAGRLAMPAFLDDEACERIAGVLAALPPPVAARLDVRIGQADAGIIQAPGAALPAQADHAGAGAALLSILRTKRIGATPLLSRVQDAAGTPWRFATTQWSLERPFAEIRHDLAWVVRCEAWLLSVERALVRGASPPAPDLPPSERLLKAAVDLFIDQDAIDRLGIFAGPEWESAWKRIEVPAWRPVIDLLAGRSVEDGDFTILSVLPLGPGVAERAAAAWEKHLPESSFAALVAMFKSTQTWVKDFIKEHNRQVTELAVRTVCDQADPAAAWAEHPLRGRPAGHALDAMLDCQPVDDKTRAALHTLGQVGADLMACVGTVEANDHWIRNIEIIGNGRGATGAALDWIAGRPFTPVDGVLEAWEGFQQPVDIVQSLRTGVPPKLLEQALIAQPDRVVAHEEATAVMALMAHGDVIDRKVWLSQFGHREPWGLLGTDSFILDTTTQRLLDELRGQEVLAAACVYGGSIPRAWGGINGEDVAQWVLAGRTLDPLAPLAAAGAEDAVAIGLTVAASQPNGQAWTGATRRDGEQLLDRLRKDIGFMRRVRVRSRAKRIIKEST